MVRGLPVPFMLAYGPSWGWIVGANVLLGMSQGLAWSMMVNMKIDLVAPRRRGLAMGLNEAAGYGAMGLTALVTGYIAASYGLRPEPFYIGIFYSIAGLLLSIALVRDTREHAMLEARAHPSAPAKFAGTSSAAVFAETNVLQQWLEAGGEAAVIDPSLPPDIYLGIARHHGWTIAHVLDTHIHADHLSRASELARQAGAALRLPPQPRARFLAAGVLAGMGFLRLASGTGARCSGAILDSVTIAHPRVGGTSSSGTSW